MMTTDTKLLGAVPRRWLAPLAALLVGVVYVATWHWVGHDRIYRFGTDSASFLEVAQSLRQVGEPLVVPWGPEPADTDATPQIYFPPGYSILISAAMTLWPDARTASLAVNSLLTASLPLLLLLLFRHKFSDQVLLFAGVLTLLTAGVQTWHYMGYSDVPGLVLSIAALGACSRCHPGKIAWFVAAGVLAGACYATRNSTLAVSVACAGWLALRTLEDRRWGPGAGFWLAGVAVPLIPLEAYYQHYFGEWQPYGLPPSTRPPLTNLADWVTSLQRDLRVPSALLDSIPEVACVVLALLLLAALLWLWCARSGPARHRVELLGLFVVASAAIHIVARSHYEWGDVINIRHTLQASWAVILLGCDAVGRWPWGQRARSGLAAVCFALFATSAVQDALAVRRSPPEEWYRLVREPGVIDVVAALPKRTFVLSNDAFLFRVEAAKPVRQFDPFAGSILELLHEAGNAVPADRAAVYMLICDEGLDTQAVCQTAARAMPAACRRLRSAAPVAWLCDIAPEH
jgi:Dolichyl-phosphate-mannose-protein mannosyltransferase